MPTIFNANVGLLGHIDSGKTTIAKALSAVASTASFDKNPQSQERGITLDLGFSSFDLPSVPEKHEEAGYEKIQITLVDCPGHAQLIKTIIGGASIIDLMVLVVDAQKGFQTQTAECLVIGEITADVLIVALNKVDAFPEGKRPASVERVTKKIRKTLESTKFKDATIVPLSASKAVQVKAGQEEDDGSLFGLQNLIQAILNQLPPPQRDESGPFIMAVDHCFQIKGQGTVATGTVTSGSVSVGDTVAIPEHSLERKVKSMQRFKKPVEKAIQGDRIGLCVTNFDAKKMERGLICEPQSVRQAHGIIIKVCKVRFFKDDCATNSQIHISMGHTTVIGKVVFFALPKADSEAKLDIAKMNLNGKQATIDQSKEYAWLPALIGENEDQTGDGGERVGFDESSTARIPIVDTREQYALVEFQHPVIVLPGLFVIGSRLDYDIESHRCRLAFYGTICHSYTSPKWKEVELQKLKVFKDKRRSGQVHRMKNEREIIVQDLFTKESNLDRFVNRNVILDTGEVGTISGGFGKSGKINVDLKVDLTAEAQKKIKAKRKLEVHMDTRKYMFHRP
eukprot:Clim_evm22s141 gene=Clim_evmTU22s141